MITQDRFHKPVLLTLRFCLLLLIGPFSIESVLTAWSEEQKPQQCRLAIQDNRDTMYELYVACAQSLDFETADSLITVKLESIASVQVAKGQAGQPQVKLTLKDGTELSRLSPKPIHLSGKILVGGTVTFFSGSLLWNRLYEVRQVAWQEPAGTAVLPAPYLTLGLKSVSFPIPARKINVYSKGTFDTGYVRTYGGFPLPGGSPVLVDEYRPSAIEDGVDLAISGLRLILPLGAISRLSQPDKVLILKNSQRMAFESAIYFPSSAAGNLVRAETSIGAWVFDYREVEVLEFFEDEPIWGHVPDEKLIEYEVTDIAQNTYRTKQVGVTFSAGHRDLRMRLLVEALRDNYTVRTGRGGDIDYRDSLQQKTNAVPIENVNGTMGRLLLDLRYVHDMKNDAGNVFVSLGQQRTIAGSIATSVGWFFDDELTGKRIFLGRDKLASVRRVMKKRLEY